MGRGTAHSIGRRLRSDSGATLVLAMLVLLAASMFSMAILSGSVNAAQAARGQYETEQSYLVVSAAAKLLHRAILYPDGTPDGEKVYKREVVILRNGEDIGTAWPINDKLGGFLTENGFEREGEQVRTAPLYRPEQTSPHSVRELLSHMYKQCETAPEEGQRNPFHSLTITLPLEGQKTRTVEVELAMRRPSDGVENPYGLTAALTIVGATDESGAADRFNPYSMTLEYTCTAIPDPVEKREPNFHIEENEEDGSKAKVLDNIETVTITTT
ncbi:MAG: hypothetical protein IJT94_06320, partial [Oscillibacter sp.]|nr:hypothetical protein [Oscillibacter sp.]